MTSFHYIRSLQDTHEDQDAESPRPVRCKYIKTHKSVAATLASSVDTDTPKTHTVTFNAGAKPSETNKPKVS